MFSSLDNTFQAQPIVGSSQNLSVEPEKDELKARTEFHAPPLDPSVMDDFQHVKQIPSNWHNVRVLSIMTVPLGS